MLKGIYILNSFSYDVIYGPEEREAIGRLIDVYPSVLTNETVYKNMDLLKDIDVVFSGWGMPVMDEEFLKAAPKLKAVFYGAGSIRYFVTEAIWNRNIVITSAYAANAIPVAEYTLSQILFCLKRGWYYAREIRRLGSYIDHENVPGAYKSTVGIISLGMIGRYVCKLLKNFDVQIIAYDPYISKEDALELGVQLCSLEDVFKRSDVVSLHTPWLKETEGMITGKHFESMKVNAAFINTSRGAVVREQEMIEVLKARTDLQAVLDVTYPEPPEEGSLLYSLPNIVLTPHIAGSMYNECRRMGSYMVEELKRYLKNEPLRWAISKEKASILA
jgi:phosphoglycerate dehydrogenase-like enzyme